MLDRTSLDAPLIELRLPRRPNHKLPHSLNDQHAQQKLDVLTARFRNALKKSVEGIIEAGRILIEAKNELEHGQFIDWIVCDLRFGSLKEGSRKADLRKADMLMLLARHEVISKSYHGTTLRPRLAPFGSLCWMST
jgi:hypothetical protein